MRGSTGAPWDFVPLFVERGAKQQLMRLSGV
jgi:hypothetical protein